MAENIETKVEKLISEPILQLGYEIYDIRYEKEGKDYFLRVFIENETGISLDDCEKVNNAIVDLLDKADYIKEQYFLEISSVGLEKTLRKEKHFETSIGEEIEIKTFKPIDGQKVFVGILTSFQNEEITLMIEGREHQFSRKDIASAKTVYQW